MTKFYFLFTFIVCLCTATNAQTNGKVEINTTVVNNATFANSAYGNYVFAIWAEDASGKFIRTILRYGSWDDKLRSWDAVSGRSKVDAVSGASPSASGPDIHTVTWDCKDVNKAIVPDGNYKICIEGSRSNNLSAAYKIPFTKGTISQTNTLANNSDLTNTSIIFTPILPQKPRPNFVATPNIVGPGGIINFTNQTDGYPESTSWLWSFEGGTPASSTDKNPTVTYNTVGKYSVSLTSTNTTGDSTKTINELITVTHTPPVTAISEWNNGLTHTKLSGKKRLLVVMVMGEHNADISANGVTYGGQAMTKQTDKIFSYNPTGNRTYSSIFTLNEAGVNAATSGTIAVNWSATPSSGSSIYSVFLSNVDQTNPVSSFASNALGSTTVSTNTLSAAVGDLIIAAGATENDGNITFKNGFTKAFETTALNWGDACGGYKNGTGTTEIPSFTQSVSMRLALCAIVVKRDVNFILKDTATNGTIALNPVGGIYTDGTKVTLTANPDPGYKFMYWIDSINSNINPVTIEMNSNKYVTAKFSSTTSTFDTLHLKNVNGSIALNPVGGIYERGTKVFITAIPNTGYRFKNWNNNNTLTNIKDSIVMDNTKTITAIFEVIPYYTLTQNNLNGTLAITPAPVNGKYAEGTTISIKATANTGYRFKSWSDASVGSTNPTTIVMNSNKTITANFEEIPYYTISITATNGSVKKDPSNSTYIEGSKVTLTATANSGCFFKSWSGDYIGTNNPAIIEMNTNKTIIANFDSIPYYTLTKTEENGTISFSPLAVNGKFLSGTKVTIEAKANEGYYFDGWTGDYNGSDNPATIVMNGNKTIEATFIYVFTPITYYTLTKTEVNGTISFSPQPVNGKYQSGTKVAIKATPNVGFYFQAWTGDYNSTKNPDTIVITANKTISATYTTENPSTNLNELSNNSNIKLSNHPNPFSTNTTISYVLEENASVELSIYTVQGNEILTLENEYKTSGTYHVKWNVENSDKQILPNGIYIYQLTINNKLINRGKCVLVR